MVVRRMSFVESQREILSRVKEPVCNRDQLVYMARSLLLPQINNYDDQKEYNIDIYFNKTIKQGKILAQHFIRLHTDLHN